MNYNCRLYDQKKVIVSSVCYMSPLQELMDLANELREKQYRGEVLFDLLCVNGNNPNRFFSIIFDGTDFDRSSAQPIVNPSKALLLLQDRFYREHQTYINSSVLSSKERVQYASI